MVQMNSKPQRPGAVALPGQQSQNSDAVVTEQTSEEKNLGFIYFCPEPV